VHSWNVIEKKVVSLSSAPLENLILLPVIQWSRIVVFSEPGVAKGTTQAHALRADRVT